MPDWTKLRPGDRIRLLRVPAADLAQRESEIARGAEMAGWTADTLERILATDPVVTIDRVDEYGAPWFDVELKTADGETEYHSLVVVDEDSWEYLP